MDNDDIPVPTSNVADKCWTIKSYCTHSLEHIVHQELAGGVFQLPMKYAIADLGATQIFVMVGTPVINKRPTTRPLRVALAANCQVMSTHMCDIKIDGLPATLTGHIIPNLSIALLFGIRILTEAGWDITFTKGDCIIKYNRKIILLGEKDPSTDLWTLPLGSHGMISQHAMSTLLSAAPDFANAHAQPAVQIAFFAHTVQTKANSICFAHQSLCSPRISTLLKAIKRGYLKGCPNLTAHGVNKYLNPSPATAKGHMKRPRQGIRSTRWVPPVPSPSVVQSRIVPEAIHPIAHTHVHVMDNDDKDLEDSIHMHVPHTNVIKSDDDSNGNVFVFAAFADKRNGTLYSNLTGAFPFMSLEGNAYFLVVYHYKTNAIMAVPIANFIDDAILKAFHQQFELLESKGHKIQLNVMDNQDAW
jgi:hypothetical protein